MNEPQDARKVVQPQPEDVLTADEAELLQRADRGEVACPQCTAPLRGEMCIIEDLYEGVVLSCAGCGFVEY